jgi:energy-coupling factor transporter ATP-binding protein EcfA2
VRVDVRHALAGLRGELGTDVERVRDLAPVALRGLELDELLMDLDRQLERVRAAAVITLVGATGAGKSTLLNALAGEAVAVEGEQRPTTVAPVIYRPVDADVRELLRGLPGEPPRLVDYDPGASGPWRGQILIDAPDVNSVATEHRDVVAALAARSDVLLVVAHRQSIAELASVAFVDAFAGRRGMLFVLGRADELLPGARAELLEQLESLARERWGVAEPAVVAISARRVQEGEEDGDWSTLTGALGELVDGGRLGRVRRLNALGTAGRLGHLFTELLDGGLGADLDGLGASLERGLEGWRARVEGELRERLELRRTDLAAMLWNESARRWEGPGGWALRVGGLSALGLGAGAALARRNPVLAAGAAVGALAVDKARGGARERGLRDTSGLLPGPSQLEDAWRAELGEARLTARALVGEADGLRVPDAENLGARAADATDEAWERLMVRDLPAAAEGALGWPIRMLVDGPVYALGGWLVYRAGVGFFSGLYVGVDFLLNAGLILLAWLFLARTLCRLLLARRAGALVTKVRGHATRALEGALRSAAAPALEAIEDRRSALQRLADAEQRWRERVLGSQ